MRLAGERQLVPLDEEATLPGSGERFGTAEAEPARPKTDSKKKSAPSEGDSLSF
jgi:hypothetical protein